jgi:ABC-type uncharacterized transport system substrate-binding protein
MRRREFIGLLGGVVACPLAARAQQSDGIRRVAALMSVAAGDPEGKARFAAFQQGLQQLGWIDGRNVRIETSGGKIDDARKYATELIALAPDAILASGGAMVGPLLQVTRTVPIVFTQTPDPVAAVFGWKRVDQHRQHIGTMRLIVRKPKCPDDCIAERRL